MPFTYPYPRPAVTCDVVVFTMRADDLAVLLIQRKDEPFKGQWALPGGYVEPNESLEAAAARELAEETGITGARLEQLGAFGAPGRDPRGHTVTVAFLTFLMAEAKISAGDDAAAAEWHPLRTLALDDRAQRRSSAKVRLAFDHAIVVAQAYRRLREHLDDPARHRTFDIVPSRFTLSELRHTYEVILGCALPPRSFTKRLVDQGVVVRATAKPTRKPVEQLYRWNRPRG